MSDATLALIECFIKDTHDALVSTEPRSVLDELINFEDNALANMEEESSSQQNSVFQTAVTPLPLTAAENR